MKTNTRILLFPFLGTLLAGGFLMDAAAADIATLIAPCEDCHGKDGASEEPKIPTIGGYSAIYITDSLAVYRDKTRPCEDVKYPAGKHKGETTNMCEVAKNLSDEESGLVAEHYAGKPFVRAKQSFDAELAKVGKGIHALECKKCHEDGGSSSDDDAGILAGQWMPYLQDQFEEYTTGKRPMTKKMKPKIEKLSADDIKALIQYYGSFQ
ncbi:MAG: c-type cytochrome [Thiogranum sp.]|jgi:sulfide dehydrogenase cytochrome subunit|nr:c-type cytochrome [Thiogranum sp.]